MSLRNSIKKIPFLVPLVRKARDLKAQVLDHSCRLLNRDHARKVFTQIYHTNYWGDPESVSGSGSSRACTVEIRKELPGLLKHLGIETLVDAPCGDFGWMREIIDQIPFYKGVDIVPEIIAQNKELFEGERVEFTVADITCDPLPRGDAILCRDCMIHLPTLLIRSALRNFRNSGYKYVFLTHDEWVTDYREILTGGWRPLNWHNGPFHFPEPVSRIIENAEQQRHLAVWELSALEI